MPQIYAAEAQIKQQLSEFEARGEADLRAEPRVVGAENRPVVETRGRFGAKRQNYR